MLGCERQSRIDQANAENRLVLSNRVEPEDLDPQVTTGVAEINIHMALFEGLTSPDPRTLEPEPGVAESWEISEDGRTYTFHLRKNAHWSNGEALTAKDFIYSWKRILNPKLGAANAVLLFVIEGAESYHAGVIDWDQVGIKALDAYTLQIRLNAPTGYFPNLLMHPAFYPVYEPAIDAKDGTERRGSGWTRPGYHVGNGPFKLQDWQPNQIVRVVKNENYWDADVVNLSAIDFLPYENATTEETAFLGQQIHLTRTLPPAKIAGYREKNSPYLRIDPYLGTYYYLINTKASPLDNPLVRKALAYSLDKQTIISRVLNGGEQPARAFTPPDTAGYTSEAGIDYNLEEARKALAEAGYANGAGFPTLTLKFNSSDNNRVLAEVVQEMWRKNLGIPVELQNEEWKSYLETRRQGDFEILRASWIGDYVDPMTFLELWKTDNQNNFSGFSDPDYDILIDEAARSQNSERRRALLEDAEQLLLESTPIIPLYHFTTPYLIRPEVRGWYPTLLDWHPYKYVYLESPQ